MSELSMVIIAIIGAVASVIIVYIICNTVIAFQRSRSKTEQNIAEIFANSNRAFALGTTHLSVKNDENESKLTYSNKQAGVFSKILHTASTFLSNSIKYLSGKH